MTERDDSAQALSDEEAIERGRLLFARPCRFVAGAARADQLPPPELTEVAFAGRSNVGKSTLVNALTGQTALARVSRTPGRTQQINFFRLDDALMLVDLPGYGYARASKEIKADWQGMMFDYLRGRTTLIRVMLLLDSRIELKPADHDVMKLLDRAAVTYQVVLTKADGLKPPALARKQEEVRELIRTHPAAFPEIATTSAETGLGIPELRAVLAQLTT